MADTLSAHPPSPVLGPPLSASPASKKASKAAEAAAGAITKRKQSKSRNGCITCKAKRLKCDETKPTCKQCARRAVTCGGYKKDFKWRPFEEPSVPGKQQPGKSRKGGLHPRMMYSAPPLPQPTSAPSNPSPNFHPAFHAPQYSFPHPPDPHSNQHVPFRPPQPFPPAVHAPALQTSFPQPSPNFAHADAAYAVPQPSPLFNAQQSVSPVDSFAPSSIKSGSSVFGVESIYTARSKVTTPSSVSSGQSPRLVDLLLPGTDLTLQPEEYELFRSRHEAIYQPTGYTPPADQLDEEVEEIPRDVDASHEAWVMRLSSPTSSRSSSSPESPETKIPAQPLFALTSPEILTRRFDRDTCGVLSVKDGPTENPWRTLVWPLARDCPALYHAIASMTSFHQSKDLPALRIQGIDHMRNAVHALANEMQNMRFDAAISTTLVLAFAESWDQHISTGINHIKGAKLLINQALEQHRQTPKKGDEWSRLKFLCNTWTYMDVIARLTSFDDDENNDVDTIQESIYTQGETDTALDPLMGCAHTLFPIIGRVANLVKRVRRLDGANPPMIVSQGRVLQAQLEEWTPPSFIEDPEDETTSPHDSIRTATAYQHATLLYLHQAVPELPSQSSAVLAKKVLCELATVDPRSRSVIVHIYPLMAAGCEALIPEDREWVVDRWALMTSRMKLGILEKCLEVTKEVWARRNAWEAERGGSFDMEHAVSDTDTANASANPNANLTTSPNIQYSSFRNHSTSSIATTTATINTTISPLKRDFESVFDITDDFEPDGDFCWLNAGPKRRQLNAEGLFEMTFESPVVLEPTGATWGGRQGGAAVNNWVGVGGEGGEWLEQEFTVRGRLHWLSVMKEWSWEVLLG